MSFYVFLCVSFLLLTTLLLENKGSDVAKGFAGFQIPFRTRDFFFFWVEGCPSCAFFYYLVQ